MKPTQVHGNYLTKEQHLQGHVDWLVKDLEAWYWLSKYWESDQFRAMSERNRQNQMSKDLVHHYGMDEHVRKTHNFNSQLLRN
jgi:hypothetical protein